MIPWLDPDEPAQPFPPLEQALIHPNGLLCAGGDLSETRLLNAYRHGVFPWYSAGEPILWWSPDPRVVIEPAAVHCSRRLARTLRSGCFRLSLDRCFETVVQRCAEPRPGQPETWITSEMMAAYGALHRAGHAHSLEIWSDDELAGGIYGIAIGRVFFGESMFHRVRDASKAALVWLCQWLDANGFRLVDGQVRSPHLARMGAHPMPRGRFRQALDRWCADGLAPGDWHSAARPVQLAPFFRDP